MSKPKSYEETHHTIKCIDCGKERVVRNQDKHQVVRCKECQQQYRIIMRRICRSKGEVSDHGEQQWEGI